MPTYRKINLSRFSEDQDPEPVFAPKPGSMPLDKSPPEHPGSVAGGGLHQDGSPVNGQAMAQAMELSY